MDLGVGVKFIFFSNYSHVANHIKGNDKYINIVVTILPIDPSWTLEVGSKGQNSTFSEHGHVAHQNEGSNEYSNMQAHILVLHAPWTKTSRVKGQNKFSLKVVMLHIKLIGMSYRAPCKHIFCPNTHPHPLDPKNKF